MYYYNVISKIACTPSYHPYSGLQKVQSTGRGGGIPTQVYHSQAAGLLDGAFARALTSSHLQVLQEPKLPHCATLLSKLYTR